MSLFNVSVSSGLWSRYPIEKFIPVLKDYNITTIEIWTNRKFHFDVDNRDQINRLKKILEENKITVSSIHTPIRKETELRYDISSLSPTVRNEGIENVKKTIELAREFGAKYIIVHPGSFIHDKDIVKERIKNSVSSLKILGEYAKRYEIILAVENLLPGRVGSRVEHIREIIENVNLPDVKLCLDTGHWNVNQVYVPEVFVEFKDFIRVIHLSDNDGTADQHRFIGEGNIDFKNLFKAIYEHFNPNGFLVFELRVAEEPVKWLEKIKNFNILKML